MAGNVIQNPYGFIYITTCLINGKRYLGQRKFNKGRQTYLGSGTAFSRAVKKYGKDNFVKEIIEVCFSSEELNEAERKYSVFFDVVGNKDFYNLVLGGGTSEGWHPSEETREKISKANKGIKSAWYGRKHTEEEKRKIGEARRGLKFSEEWRKNISEGRSGITLSAEVREQMSTRVAGKNNPMYGRTQTEKAKTAQSKPIKCVDSGALYYGIREAERQTGITRANIWRGLNGKQKTAGGLRWVYVERGAEYGS